MKNERLKKLESELKDLQQWLDLGLVPKKDLVKHQSEIEIIQKKIQEEKDRIAYLKESGELEEYTAPKRSKEPRAALDATIPDVGGDVTDAGLDMETETYDVETTTISEETEEGFEEKTFVEEEEDPFSDKNRWRRGILEDPDSDQW